MTTRSLTRPLRRLLRLAWSAALALAARPAAAQRPDTLVVATYAYPGVDRVGAIAPLAAHLAARLGRPTRAVALPDPVTLADAVRAGRVDVAVTNPFGYLLVAAGDRPAGAAVATFRVPAGVRTNYGTVLVARDTTLRTVADLAARAASLRVALVAPGSTTGNLVPRLFLATQGLADLERQTRAVQYGGTHAAAFALLRDGAADVAALATEEYERQAAADTTVRWRVLWRSPDVALGPVVVRATLPAALRSAVAAAAVGLETTAPAAFAALRGGWTEARTADALVAATDRSYDPVRRLFGADGAAAALIARFAR